MNNIDVEIRKDSKTLYIIFFQVLVGLTQVTTGLRYVSLYIGLKLSGPKIDPEAIRQFSLFVNPTMLSICIVSAIVGAMMVLAAHSLLHEKPNATRFFTICSGVLIVVFIAYLFIYAEFVRSAGFRMDTNYLSRLSSPAIVNLVRIFLIFEIIFSALSIIYLNRNLAIVRRLTERRVYLPLLLVCFGCISVIAGIFIAKHDLTAVERLSFQEKTFSRVCKIAGSPVVYIATPKGIEAEFVDRYFYPKRGLLITFDKKLNCQSVRTIEYRDSNLRWPKFTPFKIPPKEQLLSDLSGTDESRSHRAAYFLAQYYVDQMSREHAPLIMDYWAKNKKSAPFETTGPCNALLEGITGHTIEIDPAKNYGKYLDQSYDYWVDWLKKN